MGDNVFGRDLFVEEMQVACYKILNVLYPLGTAKNHFIRHLKKKECPDDIIESMESQLVKNRAAFGECLAALAQSFPVAFLEPKACFHFVLLSSAMHSLVTSSHLYREILKPLKA